MNTIFTVAVFSALVCSGSRAQAPAGGLGTDANTLPEDLKVERFEISDLNFAEAVAELSRAPAGGLHLGFEEIIGERYSDPVAQGLRFSLRLEKTTVREVLDALCGLDSRYTWSTDSQSINIYPRATAGDAAYLLNLRIEPISLVDAANPYAVLKPLSLQHPEQQIGYAQLGGDPGYAEPWTVTFEDITVRQLMNRAAEHMGQRTTWTWHGIKTERMFGFFKGGYHTQGR